MKRAVLMIIDGLRADMVTPEYTPVLAAIAAGSRVFIRQRSVFPSATRVNSASISTGCFPKNHGLFGNAIALDEGEGLKPVSVGPPEFRERLRAATGRTLLRPALAERVRDHGGAVIYSNSSAGAAHMQDPDGHGWLYHRSGSFAPGLKPIDGDAGLNVSYDGVGDAQTTARFCEAMHARPAVPLFVTWVCEPDHSQHTLELGSPRHREVILGSDRCAAEVEKTVEGLRAQGDDVLFILGSDHGHESVDAIVPVERLLIEAGLKSDAESREVVYASSGMGALVYLSAEATDRRDAIVSWLERQDWCGEVYAGASLESVGLAERDGLAVAFSMAKRDESNRYAIRGFGHVAADRFMKTDAPGLGQHGGLGPFETNPFLIVNGGGFEPGSTETPSRTVDIAPTILRHLGLPVSGVDGDVPNDRQDGRTSRGRVSRMSDDEDDKTMIVAPGTAYQMAAAPHSRLKCTDPALLGLGPGAEILLDVDQVTIGRGADNSVALHADGVSRMHARVYPAEQGWWVEDVGSTNGVRVNSEKIERIALKHGDNVEIGSVPFIFTVDSQTPREEAATRMEFAAQTTKTTQESTAKPTAAKPTAAKPAAAKPPAAKRPKAKTGKTAGPAGSNALLWIIMLLGAGVFAFAIYSMLMQ
jgi:predicted AlkP superfamily pyrophosphatase or phosphodiesterase